MPRTTTLAASIAVLAVAAAAVWFVPSSSEPAPPAARPNVVMISIDTLRADRLGAYGHTVATSPMIDQFRKDAVLFSKAYSAAPVTLMSHATIFTSLIPQHHGASYQQLAGLSDDALTLAEVFKAANYSTFAVTAGGQMDAAYGLNQGFDVYEEKLTFPETTTRALALLDARPQPADPFFLFLHTYDVHSPYRHTDDALDTVDPGYKGTFPSEVTHALINEINGGKRPLSSDDQRRLLAIYDAGILTMDREFGRLMQALRDRGLYDNSLIVLVSDHGEEFGEHGVQATHSHTLYDELLHIPLIVKLPASARGGERVDALVRTLDVAPALVAQAGLTVPPVFQGRDILSPLPPNHDPDNLIVLRREVGPNDRELWTGVRTLEWKLYGPRLYDLRVDPGERADVATRHPRVVEALSEARDAEIRARQGTPTRQVQPSDTLRERLRSLGYTGGGN